MKTKNQKLILFFLIITVLFSCGSKIKPNGKYTLESSNKKNKYLFEFLEDGVVKISQNHDHEFGNVMSIFQRRNDLIGNLLNTLKGNAFVDPQGIKFLNDNRNEVISLMNKINPNNYTLQELNKIKDVQINFNYLFEFAKINPELMSNNNFVGLVSNYENSENQLNNTFSNLELVMCYATGNWDTNHSGDIILTNVKNIKSNNLPDFNGEYKAIEDSSSESASMNYSRNEFTLSPKLN